MYSKTKKIKETIKECTPKQKGRLAWLIYKDALYDEMKLWREAYKESVKRY